MQILTKILTFCIVGIWANLAVSGTLEVVGEGAVIRAPNYATLDVVFVEKGENPAEVMQVVRKRVDEAVQTYVALGIPEEHIYSNDFEVSEDYQGSEYTGPTIYGAATEIRVKQQKTGEFNVLLDGAFKVGASEINNLKFDYDATQKDIDEALRLAIEDAHRQAKFMADSAGVFLGDIISMEEQTPSGYSIAVLSSNEGLLQVNGLYSPAGKRILRAVEIVFEIKPLNSE